MKILLLAALCLFVASLSYGKTPGPVVPAENPKKEVAADQRGSEQSSVIIKILPSTKDEVPPSNTTSEHKSNTDWWVDHSPEIFIALFTLGLWCATYQLVREAKLTAQRQLRAYISVIKVFAVKNTVKPELPAFAITIRNSGQTPAYSINSWQGIGIQKHPLTSRLGSPPDPSPGTDVILGNGAQIGYRDEVQTPFRQEEMDDVRAGKAAIYFWGRIEYSDSFNHRHFTNFCLFQLAEGAMRYSHIGNDAD